MVVFPKEVGEGGRVYSTLSLSTRSGNTYDNASSMSNTYDSMDSRLLHKEAPEVARQYRKQKTINHSLKQKLKHDPQWKTFANRTGERYKRPEILANKRSHGQSDRRRSRRAEVGLSVC